MSSSDIPAAAVRPVGSRTDDRKDNGAASTAALSSADKKKARDRRAQRNLREKRIEYTNMLEAKIRTHEAIKAEQEKRIQELLALSNSLRAQNENLRLQRQFVTNLLRNWDGEQLPLVVDASHCDSGVSIGDVQDSAASVPVDVSLRDLQFPPGFDDIHLLLQDNNPQSSSGTQSLPTEIADSPEGSTSIYSSPEMNQVPHSEPLRGRDQEIQFQPSWTILISQSLEEPKPMEVYGLKVDNFSDQNTRNCGISSVSHSTLPQSSYPSLEGSVDAWCAAQVLHSPLGQQQLELLNSDESLAFLPSESAGLDPSTCRMNRMIQTETTPLKTMTKHRPVLQNTKLTHARTDSLISMERLFLRHNRWKIVPPARFVNDISLHYTNEYLLQMPEVLNSCEDIPPVLGLLYGSKTNILANSIFESVKQFKCPQPEMLASGWLQYLMTKWRVSPTPERFERIPEFYRPTGKQLVIPHRPSYDQLLWPRLRQNFIKYGDSYSMKDVFGFFACCLRVRWPFNEPFLEVDDHGKLTIKKEFLDVILTEEGWGLTADFFHRYTDLVEGLDVQKVLFTMT